MRKKEAQAEEAAKEMCELRALSEKLRGEAVRRERELSERDKRILSMATSTQRLESNKQLLELRVKELEEVHEPMMMQLFELKMANNKLESELLAEAAKCKEGAVQLNAQTNRAKQLEGALRQSDRRLLDVDKSHSATLSQMHSLVDSGSSLATIADFIRKRDKELQRSHAAGEPRKDRAVGADSDAELRQELMRQRDRMQGTVDRLASELQRSKDKAQAHSVQLAAETQRAHEQLNEQRRKNIELSQQLEAYVRQGREPGSSRGLAKSGGQLRPLLGAGGSGALPRRGLTHSATVGGELGVRAAAPSAGLRPGTAPGLNGTVDGAPFDLNEHMERQMLENQRLREQLLHFTTKAKGTAQGRKSSASFGMPLPPV
jgi:hypothetical protein